MAYVVTTTHTRPNTGVDFAATRDSSASWDNDRRVGAANAGIDFALGTLSGDQLVFTIVVTAPDKATYDAFIQEFHVDDSRYEATVKPAYLSDCASRGISIVVTEKDGDDAAVETFRQD